MLGVTFGMTGPSHCRPTSNSVAVIEQIEHWFDNQRGHARPIKPDCCRSVASACRHAPPAGSGDNVYRRQRTPRAGSADRTGPGTGPWGDREGDRERNHLLPGDTQPTSSGSPDNGSSGTSRRLHVGQPGPPCDVVAALEVEVREVVSRPSTTAA